MSLRSYYLAAVLMTSVLVPAIAHSAPVTLAEISGAWELRTACMNDHGKPGTCIEMKHGSLELTFDSGGKWNSVANDQSNTRKSGSYEIKGSNLILKNDDGSTYQNWQPSLSDDRQSFLITSKQLIETFVRIK